MATENPLAQISLKRIAVPVFIGVVVSFYLLVVVSKFDFEKLAQISLTRHLLAGFVFAAIAVLVRDVAYMYRIWMLTGRQLSWRVCFEVIFLWEFGSSITPASIGGITMALFILVKEKINLGKSTSIIMFCSYLDNIAFVLVFSSLYFLLGNKMFDFSASCSELSTQSSFQFFRSVGQYAWFGFSAVALSGGFLGFAIFVMPHWAKHFLQQVAAFKWLAQWKDKIEFLGEEIELTSREFKNKGFLFLLQVLVATIVSWCARYALANALIWSFSDGSFSQFEIFARQYVHRVIVMIPATPGGSGIAEISFMALNCDFIQAGYAALVATLWRIYNFYFYIVMGLIILPTWLVRTRKEISPTTNSTT